MLISKRGNLPFHDSGQVDRPRPQTLKLQEQSSIPEADTYYASTATVSRFLFQKHVDFTIGVLGLGQCGMEWRVEWFKHKMEGDKIWSDLLWISQIWCQLVQTKNGFGQIGRLVGQIWTQLV